MGGSHYFENKPDLSSEVFVFDARSESIERLVEDAPIKFRLWSD